MNTPPLLLRAGLTSVFLVVAFSSRVAVSAESVQVRRDVLIDAGDSPGDGGQRLIAVRFDADVYETTTLDLDNLRVEDDRGQPVACVVQEVRGTDTRTVRSTWEPTSVSARRVEEAGEERLVVTLTVAEDAGNPSGLRIVSPLRDFERTVALESSPDGEAWQACGEAGLIFDYARFIDIRNDELRIPPTSDRFFRLTMARPTREEETRLLEITRRLEGEREASRDERARVDRVPFRIDRVEFFSERQEPIASTVLTQSVVPRELTVTEDATSGQTTVQFRTHREPLTSLTLLTPVVNFSRHATLLIATEERGESWTEWADAQLSSIDFQGFQRAKLALAFPQTRAGRYRLMIDHGDSPPLDVVGVQLEGRVHAAVFLAEPARGYQLVYGDGVEQSSGPDAAVVRELLAKGFAAQDARLGPSLAEPVLAPRRPWWEAWANRWTLIGVAAVLVVVLGRGLVAAAKRVDRLEGEA